MKTTLLTVLLILSPALLHAGEALALMRPEATKTLAVRKLERSQGLFAEFEGRLTVSGTLVAEWIQGVDEDTDNTLAVQLIPDAITISGLPYFDRYPVRKLDIENKAEALRIAIPTNTLTRLKRKDLRIVRATGTFVLTNYVVGIECDASWARGKMVTAKIPKPLNLAGAPESFGC